MGKNKLKNINFNVAYDVDKQFDSDKFLKLRMRVCHDGGSPNKTNFTKETMEEANAEIEYIPILANVKYDSEGKPMFGSHDMHVEQDRLNSNEQKVIFDETPIGLVPSNAENNCTVEKFNDRYYTFVDAYVWREYSNYAEPLLENAVESKLSMEISIPEDSIAYNAKEKYWDISKYKYRGITMLNPDCGTGMANALATTGTFECSDLKEKMLVLMEQLQDCLHDYNRENCVKGGTDSLKITELLEKYSKNMEDITFEIDGLTDEELEIKFKEVFETDETVEEEVVADGTVEEPSDDTEETTVEESEETEAEEETVESEDETVEESEDESVESEDAFAKKRKKCSLDENGDMEITFALSHSDIRQGLYALLTPVEEADNEWYYICSVYDDHFVYESWSGDKVFGQTYALDGDNISFSNERYNLHRELLTDSEYASLNEMRTNYSSIVEQLNTYKEAEQRAEKEVVFTDETYDEFLDTAECKEIKENISAYTLEQLKEKCEIAFAKLVRTKGEFSLNKTETKKQAKVSFSYGTSEQVKDTPYGNLEFLKK